jgi:plastocyanin
MRVRGKLTAGVAAAVVLVPAAALADERIDAAPSNRFSTPNIEIDQGERVIFRNTDVSTHDVTASAKGPDGKPLFASKLIDRGEEAEVIGADSLATGSYPFVCSVHAQMTGTIKVNANGTPKPRATTGGGTAPAPGATPAADTDAPTLGVTIRSQTIRSTRSDGVLKLAVKVDEASSVTLRAIARPKAGGPLVTIATGKVTFDGAGKRNVEALLTQAGRKALKGRKRLAVVVTAKATDKAGNASEEAHGRTLGLKRAKR